MAVVGNIRKARNGKFQIMQGTRFYEGNFKFSEFGAALPAHKPMRSCETSKFQSNDADLMENMSKNVSKDTACLASANECKDGGACCFCWGRQFGLYSCRN